MFLKKTGILASFMLLFLTNTIAQVSIGAPVESPKGSLLQVKEFNPTNPNIDNATVSTGGFLMPRVKLVIPESLQPFIDPSDSDYALQTKLHAGLTVFNLTQNEGLGLYPGLYTWNGDRWVLNIGNSTTISLTIDPLALNFGSGHGANINNQLTANIAWMPATATCGTSITHTLNGGVQKDGAGYVPPNPLTGNNYALAIKLDDMPLEAITANPFLERQSVIEFKVVDSYRVKKEYLTLRQTNYALVVSNFPTTLELGKSFTTKIASNTDWALQVTNAAFTTPPPMSGGNNTAGETFSFTVVDDDTREGEDIIFTFSSPTGKFLDQVYTLKIKRNYPNAYIVNPDPVQKTEFEFPVRKLYNVWEVEFPNKLPAGALTPYVEWQSSQSLIEDLQLVGTGKDAIVKFKVAAGNIQGNAVIGAKIGADTYWSWHIWITDYNPDSAVEDKGTNTQSFDTAEGNKIYRYNNTERVVTFMDRNMGAELGMPPAITTNVNDRMKTYGMYYSWGRKDPFPTVKTYLMGNGPLNNILLHELTLYDGSNAEIKIRRLMPPAGDGGTNDPDTNNTDNRIYSIKNPRLYINGNNDNGLDWYSNTAGVANPNLWSEENGDKGMYDPCPAGWRVPTSGAGYSNPWLGLTPTNAVRMADNIALAPGDSYTGNSQRGYFWNQVGYFPASGFRYLGGGALMGNNLSSTLTMSTTATSMATTSFYFVTSPKDVSATQSTNFKHGYPVRCIKDR